MAIIVQKFGGTSVGDIEKIQNIARKIITTKESGKQVVVVVSAMAGVTNQLASYCSRISDLSDASKLSEYDVALSSGEAVTASLLSLALQQRGYAAKSVLGWQLPIRTTASFSKALVSGIDSSLLHKYLSEGIVPIIAGFQGLDDSGRLTTLGRGGSDTTATAIAASLQAESCDIYTDVEGVFTADPRLVPNARKIDAVGYEEMLEFAGLGAKVLHSRSVEIAMRYSVPIRVISSFTERPGTIITNQDKIMESRKITGIASNKNLAALYIKPKGSPELFEAFAKYDIHLEMIYQGEGEVMCLIPLSDLARAQVVLRGHDFRARTDIAIVSAIGFGIKNDTGIFGRIIGSLRPEAIEIMMMTSSEVKISIMIAEPETERVVKILHGLLC